LRSVRKEKQRLILLTVSWGLASSNAPVSYWPSAKKQIDDILGSPGDMKFRSSITLFDAVSKREIFAEAIGTFYPEGKDPATLDILRQLDD
jgi:hypothetical protein